MNELVSMHLDRVTLRVGYSEAGRPIDATVVGTRSAPLKIVVLAGQHGDEPLARQAASALLAQSDRLSRWARRAQTMVIVNANPDGAARGTRCNARGIDLNRDHQLLHSAEVTSLHRLIRRWQPHLVVDLHTYPPRRKHLLALGLEYCHDVFIDWPSQPAITTMGDAGVESALLCRLIARLRGQACRCGRYTLVRRSGRVRHSTPDVVDARNGLALRYGTRTLLVEGRQPAGRETSAAARRTVAALQATLEEIVLWATAHQSLLMAEAGRRRAGDRIPISCRYHRSSETCRMAFRETGSLRIRQVCLPGPYTPNIDVTQSTPLPVAYAVSKHARPLLALMRRHGFVACAGSPDRMLHGERYHVGRLRPSRRLGRAPRELELHVRQETVPGDDYVVFPTDQRGGIALSLFLEPASKYGLARWPESGLTMRSGEPYPVLRVVLIGLRAKERCPPKPTSSQQGEDRHAKQPARRWLGDGSGNQPR